MVIGIAGGTGTVGRHVTTTLADEGHDVRVLSRRPPRQERPGVEHREVDLTTGAGLDGALAGVDVVVEATNRTGADGLERLLAAERRAGVGHHLQVSIAGADRVPIGYYETTTARERAVREGGVPWSVVRSTQFHDLLDWAFRTAAAKARVLLAPDVLLRPVDPRFVAGVLAEVAEGAPLLAARQVAGPEAGRLRDLARAWREATGSRAPVVPLPLPARIGRPLAQGALAPEDADQGGPAFAEWLAARRGAVPA